MAKIEVILDGQNRQITKHQLFALARRGMIGPKTSILVDGSLVMAKNVKGIIFASSDPDMKSERTEKQFTPDIFDIAAESLSSTKQITPPKPSCPSKATTPPSLPGNIATDYSNTSHSESIPASKIYNVFLRIFKSNPVLSVIPIAILFICCIFFFVGILSSTKKCKPAYTSKKEQQSKGIAFVQKIIEKEFSSYKVDFKDDVNFQRIQILSEMIPSGAEFDEVIKNFPKELGDVDRETLLIVDSNPKRIFEDLSRSSFWGVIPDVDRNLFCCVGLWKGCEFYSITGNMVVDEINKKSNNLKYSAILASHNTQGFFALEIKIDNKRLETDLPPFVNPASIKLNQPCKTWNDYSSAEKMYFIIHDAILQHQQHPGYPLSNTKRLWRKVMSLRDKYEVVFLLKKYMDETCKDERGEIDDALTETILRLLKETVDNITSVPDSFEGISDIVELMSSCNLLSNRLTGEDVYSQDDMREIRKSSLTFEEILRSGNIDDMKYYMVTDPRCIEKCHEDKKIELMFALRSNKLEFVQFLVEHGTNVKSRDAIGRTCLHFPFTSNIEIIKYLIDKGADINAKDFHGNTPLHYWAAHYDERVVRYLLERGADVNARSKSTDGETPILACVKSKHSSTGVAKCLIEHGADLTVQELHGWNNKSLADIAKHDDSSVSKYIDFHINISNK